MKRSDCRSELGISEVEAIPFQILHRRVHRQAIGALDAIEDEIQIEGLRDGLGMMSLEEKAAAA